ncbi:MAG: NAD-dependent epimerase/dehydratase family protein [Halothiobacillaceae bacterium]
MLSGEGRVLVTGASGFVGRALLARLGRDLPAERLRAAVREAARLSGPVCGVAVGDIGPDTDWSEALAGVDTVIHLAARVHVMREGSGLDEAKIRAAYRTVNALGTERLAEQAAAAGVRRMILVSSIKVLGEGTRPGQAFGPDDPPAPVDPYGQSKLEAEQALARIGNERGMEWVVLRPPLVYGPGVGANFARLWQAVARGLPLPLGGFDQNARSLVSLDNLVDLLMVCLHHPKAAGQRLLVHDGVPVSTAGLVRAMARAQGRRVRLVPVPRGLIGLVARLAGRGAAYDRLAGDLVVDDAETRRLLDWRPPVTMEQTLAKMAAGSGGGRPHGG